MNVFLGDRSNVNVGYVEATPRKGKLIYGRKLRWWCKSICPENISYNVAGNLFRF